MQKEDVELVKNIIIWLVPITLFLLFCLYSNSILLIMFAGFFCIAVIIISIIYISVYKK